MNVGVPLPLTLPTSVKLLRNIGGDNYTVTQQASFGLNNGLNAVNVRMPVQVGERLALRGTKFTFMGTESEATLICGGGGEGTVGGLTADPGPGASAEFPAKGTARLPVSAVIEPDADNDGYGDETQDKCPTSAAVQVPCPAITIEGFALAGNASVTVVVSANRGTPVSVSGTVKLGKGKTAKLKARKRPSNRDRSSASSSSFPAKLKTRLKELSRARH